ncbi:MAG: tRNA (adenosine(37)-N6)-dimethylallyltransferase MiaA [Halioglobus sp.]|nr:tRNA (adenosine(37)-N6)-dimethylallyltransferase MiaA [Halioglobus sp.]
MSAPRPLLICLLGPTASGKTDLAIELAERCGGELISVDSALVYRGLDIGTAKPDYPHHLVDIRDPTEVYSAADFVRDAGDLARDITARGRTPLLVGGSMLYFRAFLHGLAQMPPADAAIRAAIAETARLRGWPAVHAELARVDPAAAARIHPNHSQRVSRALEVYRASGIPLSHWHRVRRERPADPFDRYRIVQMALCPADRAVLHERIEQRWRRMLRDGLLEEVRQLWRRPDLDPSLPALRSVGYRQLWRYLDGEYGWEEAQESALAATRQLAKRQLTWLRKWPDLAWIYTDRAGNLSACSLSEPGVASAAGSPLDLALNYLDTAAT